MLNNENDSLSCRLHVFGKELLTVSLYCNNLISIKKHILYLYLTESPMSQTDLKRVDEKVIEFAESLQASEDDMSVGVAATTYQGIYTKHVST